MAKEAESPEEGANWLSNLFLCWTYPIFRKGNQRVLNEEDMYPLTKERESKYLTTELATAWKKTVANSRPSLLKAILSIYSPRFAFIGLIYLLKEGILQVFLSLALGQFIGAYGASAKTQSTTVAYIGLVFIIASAVYAFITNHWYLSSMKLGFRASTAVTGLVFLKILRISPSAIHASSSASPINLIAADTKRFETGIGMIHAIWVGPVVFVLVGTIIWLKWGPEVMAGFVMMLILSILAGVIGKLYMIVRQRTAGNADERLKLINNIITEIRVIKTNVWERLFLDPVEAVRERELEAIKQRQLLTAFSCNIQTLYSRITILVTLLTYVFCKDPINAEKVFVVMSFYNIVVGVMSGSFPAAILIVAELRVSIRRMQNFLLLPERKGEGVLHLPGKPSPFKTYGKVAMTEYSGSWGQDDLPVIQNITLRLGAGHPIFVLGPVGSGKTSLLSAILGELETIHGKIDVEGRLTLAAQAPWAYTGTLQENILFGKPLSQPWYQQILDATALVQDIQKFPAGDLTAVGDKGITLSGGQKARINLARALYADADVCLLDDVLSAVDPRVGQEIWKKVVKGLLKEKCLLVATNQVQFVAKDDHVLLLEAGKVKDFGLRSDVEQRHPDEFKQAHKGEQDDQSEEVFSLNFQTSARPKRSLAIDSESDPLIPSAGASLREDRRAGLVGLGLCWRYLRAGNSMPRLVVVVLLLILSQAAMSLSDVWLTQWTNSSDSKKSTGPSFYPIVYTSLIIFDFAIGWISNYFYFIIGVSSGKKLHSSALKALIHTKLSFFEQNPSGRILNRFSKDMSNVDEYLGLTLYGVINCGLQVFGVIVVACYLNPILILPSIILCALFYSMRRFYLSASSDIKRLEAIARSPVYSLLNVALEGITTVRAFKQEQFMLDTFFKLKDAHSRTLFMFVFTYTWFTLVLSLLILAFQSVVIVSFVYLVSDKAAAALIITSIFTVSEMFSAVVQRTADLENDLVSVERIIEYAELPAEGENGGTGRWVNGSGSVDMDNLEIKYGDHNLALRGVTCGIKGGEKVGIIGRTGAGKSSIVAALLRLVEPSGGRILINGNNTQALLLRELRSNISVISQTPGFLNGTLRKNLDPFEEHSDGEIWSILGSLNLTAKVKENPDTIYQTVDIGGGNFSQGERQLISLGRVLLSKKRIVILDEASANLDFNTDEVIQSVIRDKCENVTVIAIAHRWETILHYDRILVLEDGKVVDFDTPDVIFSRQGNMEL